MSAYSDRILSLLPLVYYRLGEASGVSAVDASGHGNDGVYSGSPALGQSGSISDGDKSVRFDGVDDFIALPSSVVLSGGSITVEFWNYVATADTGNNSGAFGFGASQTVTGHAPYSDKRLYWDYGNASSARVSVDYTPYLDKWVLIHLTFDLATSKHAISINGVEVASSINAAKPAGSVTGGYVCRANPAFNYLHKGMMDEFAVYDYALSPSDRLANYNVGRTGDSAYVAAVLADSPRGYWRLGESSFPVLDSSGNGTDFNSASTGGTLVFGQASLLGTDAANKSLGFTTGWLSRAATAALDVKDVFTIEAWVKLTTLTHAYMAIYTNWTGSCYLRITDANQLQLISDSTQFICTSTVAITDLNAHHVVATKNGPTVKLYIDGVDVTGAITNYTFTAVTGWMAIGYSPGGGTEPANMTMDEVALYGTALSPARVLAHYNAGATAPHTPQTVDFAAAISTLPGPICGQKLVGTFNVANASSGPGATIVTDYIRGIDLSGVSVTGVGLVQALAQKTVGLGAAIQGQASVSSILGLQRNLSALISGKANILAQKITILWLSPTTPGSISLPPTQEEDLILPPTVEEDWLLVPTEERG